MQVLYLDLLYVYGFIAFTYGLLLYWGSQMKAGNEIKFMETISTALIGLLIPFICLVLFVNTGLIERTSRFSNIGVVLSVLGFVIINSFLVLGTTELWIRKIHQDLIPSDNGSLIFRIFAAYLETIFVMGFFYGLSSFLGIKVLPDTVSYYFARSLH